MGSRLESSSQMDDQNQFSLSLVGSTHRKKKHTQKRLVINRYQSLSCEPCKLLGQAILIHDPCFCGARNIETIDPVSLMIFHSLSPRSGHPSPMLPVRSVQVYLSKYTHTDIYIYVYVHAHTHTHIYIYIYVSMYVCMYVQIHIHSFGHLRWILQLHPTTADLAALQ